MTDNLLKSMLSEIWNAFDVFTSIDVPITDEHTFTVKGFLFLIVCIALLIPFINLIMGKE